MKKHWLLVIALMCSLLAAETAWAQFYVGPFLGFRSYGLKGAIKTTTQAGTTVGNVADAGKTGFNFGVTAGYQVFPPDFANGMYKLDVDLDASFTSAAFFEAGYNSANGAGRFSADGLSGGTTKIFSFDIMPIHRLEFKSFKLLSPFAGLGVSVNLMSTSDVSVSNQQFTGTITSVSETKVGLLVFYGTVIRATNMIQPYVEFRHLIPFGSETQFTESASSTQGGGSSNYQSFIEDVPSYFSITAGVRFVFE